VKLWIYIYSIDNWTRQGYLIW